MKQIKKMGPIALAKSVPCVSEIVGEDVEDLRRFLAGYVPLSAYLVLKGIKIFNKKDSPHAWTTAEWSTVYRRIAVELHAEADIPAFKKSTNGLSVYNLDFLELWKDEAVRRLLRGEK